MCQSLRVEPGRDSRGSAGAVKGSQHKGGCTQELALHPPLHLQSSTAQCWLDRAQGHRLESPFPCQGVITTGVIPLPSFSFA